MTQHRWRHRVEVFTTPQPAWDSWGHPAAPAEATLQRSVWADLTPVNGTTIKATVRAPCIIDMDSTLRAQGRWWRLAQPPMATADGWFVQLNLESTK